jgi:DNA-binding NarL/FixJ family response regulator
MVTQTREQLYLPLPMSSAPVGISRTRLLRVLLVDDHMLVRAGLRSVLEGRPDIEVVGEAATGEEAVALAERLKPDVVLMDLDMPGNGGIEATRVLTQREVPPSVIVLTMYTENDRLVEALRAGARGYITKELAAPELIGAIHAAAAGDIYVRPQAARLLAASLRRQAPPSGVDATQAARERFESLSARERAVLRLVAEGYTGREIGESLGITAKTVDTYRHRIQEKIGLTHRAEYIRFALTIDLVKK